MKSLSCFVLLSMLAIPAGAQKHNQICPDFSWLNATHGSRPKYVWENTEDIIYHELAYPDSLKQTAPEFFALMRCPWVFNRAMRWDHKNGTIIAASEGADLMLTGNQQVSAWYSDPDNVVRQAGEYTVFEKKNGKRQRDCSVLPALQFHLGQHPVVELEVAEANSDWQFCISVKGRSGPPLICSGWKVGSGKFRFDIAAALCKAGYELNYAELHFVVGTWNVNPAAYSKITYKAVLKASPAIVACLPVIRTKENAVNGVIVTAKITHAASYPQLRAKWDRNLVPMNNTGAFYEVLLPIHEPGNYEIEIEAADGSLSPAKQVVRITDGKYYQYDSLRGCFQKNQVIAKPLTGSYQGSFFVKDLGLRSEQMIMSQTEWDQWDRTQPPGERLLSWESLTREELAYRFAYLNKNQWELLHLHSHYGIWERFDAVGNLAPHGIEQFALYVRLAEQYGMHTMVTLSSYPYGINNTAWDGGTCPYQQYIDAGFKNEDWYHPENEPFRTIYHAYLRDFISTFKDETAVFSMSSSGEGDWKGTWKRFEDTRQVIRSIDTNHIIVSEPIMSFDHLPTKQVEGFNSDVVGYRNYALGGKFNTEEEMGICTRLAQVLPNSFIAEGSYPGSNAYTCMTFDSAHHNCWVGTDYYRISLRDWLYMGLIARMPAIITWDEVFTEDERFVLNQVKAQIDWNKNIAKPRVAILINDTLTNWDGRPYLAKYERIFSKHAIAYRFIEDIRDAGVSDYMINPLDHLTQSDSDLLAKLPATIKLSSPFKMSEGYSACYFETADRSQILAYVYNTSHHDTIAFYLSGNFQRTPLPVHAIISNLNVLPGSNCKVYDLNDKIQVFEGEVTKKSKLDMGVTNHDFLILITMK